MMLKLFVGAAGAILIETPCFAAELIIGNNNTPVALIEIAHPTHQMAAGASLCETGEQRGIVEKVFSTKEDKRIVESFSIHSGAKRYHVTVSNIMDGVPMVYSHLPSTLIKTGAKLRVIYEVCGRNPNLNALSVLSD